MNYLMTKATKIRDCPLTASNNESDSDDTLLQSSIGYQVRQTNRMSESYMQSKLARHDVQLGMWYLLRTLWIEDGLTQRELSRRVGISEPTTLEQLRKMEKGGLVARHRDPTDGRKTLVSLSSKGTRLKNSLLKYVHEMNEVAFRNFTKNEIIMLKQLLGKVRRNFREHSPSNKITQNADHQ